MRISRFSLVPDRGVLFSLAALMVPLFLWVSLSSSPLRAQEGSERQEGEDVQSGADDLGTVDFRVACQPEVREDFDRGVALLHHMMYQEARAAFREIAERDPECAMAQWGIATTLFQPLWPTRPDAEDRRLGWETIQRAREAGPGTERERALVGATAAFFQEPEAEEWWPRIRRWAEAMDAAYQQHPRDDEISAFYGLSLLSVGQVADDRLAHHTRAAGILAGLHERAPRHPGAIHYLIHADDASGRAEEHLEIVERYSDIAPRVPHALHMPSHIYVRIGDWNEVIRWNRPSARAALERSTGDRVSLHHLHALDYLIYAHLQRGDDEAAAAVLTDQVVDDRPYQDNFISAYHLAVMPARYAVERRDWKAAARIQPRAPDYLAWERYAWPRALGWFAQGVGAARTGDVAAAREAEQRMAEIKRGAREKGEEGFVTEIEIDRLVLAGWIAHAEGDPSSAVEQMRAAAEMSTTIEKNPVSPGALLPPYESLGDLLMKIDRPGEAQEAYEASMDIWPRRYRSLLGAARAAREAGDREASREHYEALLEVVQGADSDRPGVREAKEALRMR